MPYVITRMCERIGACADVCPTDSIHFVDEDQEWPTYYINPETCIDCGACASECPTGAIFPEEDVPEEYLDDIDLNADFFGKGPGAEFA
jgi:ferredoxin--NADP+ reductase